MTKTLAYGEHNRSLQKSRIRDVWWVDAVVECVLEAVSAGGGLVRTGPWSCKDQRCLGVEKTRRGDVGRRGPGRRDLSWFERFLRTC